MPSKEKGEPANRSKEVKKRTYVKRTPQARAYAKPGKVKESGVGAYSAIRLAQAGVKAGTRTRPRTKAESKERAKLYANIEKKVKEGIKSGRIKPLPEQRGSYGRLGPNVARQKKAPVKPSKRGRRG